MERRAFLTLGTLRMEASLLTRDWRFSIELGLFGDFSIGLEYFAAESRGTIYPAFDSVYCEPDGLAWSMAILFLLRAEANGPVVLPPCARRLAL